MLDDCQPHQVRKRRAIRARYAALAEEGVLHPITEDGGLDTVAYEPGSKQYDWEQAGTRMRLERGDHLRIIPAAISFDLCGPIFSFRLM